MGRHGTDKQSVRSKSGKWKKGGRGRGGQRRGELSSLQVLTFWFDSPAKVSWVGGRHICQSFQPLFLHPSMLTNCCPHINKRVKKENFPKKKNNFFLHLDFHSHGKSSQAAWKSKQIQQQSTHVWADLTCQFGANKKTSQWPIYI